jgi:hypothetical protein
LDTRTSLEIEQHLKMCPACARFFTEEEKLEAGIAAGLNRGPRTTTLWEQIERKVAATAHSVSQPPLLSRVSQPIGWRATLESLGAHLRAGWQPARWVWAGLATAWMLILGLNLAAREPDAPVVARQQLPSPSEMRFALQQEQLLMADLTLTSEPGPARKPKPAPMSPRSDRRMETLNA